MLSFVAYRNILQWIEESMYSNVDNTIEGFLDELAKRDPSIVETVMTGDIASNIPPLKLLKRRNPSNISTNPEKEEWILANKFQFQKEYGDAWEDILNATADKLFT